MIKIIKKFKEEVIVCLIFLVFALGFNIYRVQGDGLLYYAFLERLLHVPNPESSPVLQNLGFQQSGCAFFNAPFYIMAYLIENLFHKSWNFNGITLRQISINLSSNFYMLLSLVLSVKILRKINLKHIILSIIGVLFSTSAFVVAVVMPSHAHTADIFLNTLFIYLFIKNQDNEPGRAFWLGLVCVLMISVRYFNCFLIFPLMIYFLSRKEYEKIKYFLIGFIGIGWTMPLIFYIFNGGIFSPMFVCNSVMKHMLSIAPLFPKYFLKYLVHPLHGLFVWSPVVILSALGLLVISEKKDKLGYLFLGMWFLLVLGYGFFYDWHAGWSFSNRYLVGLFPIYIIGLAAFLEKYGNRMNFLVIVMTFYSLFLFFNWYICVIHGGFDTPFNVFEYWAKGETPLFPDKVNLTTFLNKIWVVCRYRHILKFFL